MPLTLVPPVKGKTPYYYVRGTYLSRYVCRTTRTASRTVAKAILKEFEREIERGLTARVSFRAAAQAYVAAGGEATYLKPILARIGELPIDQVDQSAIDRIALEIYPKASAATRNRQVYTPVSAVLKRAGVERQVKRPKGHAGKARLNWLQPDEAEALLQAAGEIDTEFGVFLTVLLYTGLRFSEALGLQVRQIDLTLQMAFVPVTKNGEARSVYLPQPVITALQSLDLSRAGPVFLNGRGRCAYLLTLARVKTGLSWPTFHSLRHTYATWMRRYGGLDTRGLVGTGAWKDEKSAARYAHTVVSEEARRADLLPRLV